MCYCAEQLVRLWMFENQIQDSHLRLLTLVTFYFALKVSSIALNIIRCRTFLVCCNNLLHNPEWPVNSLILSQFLSIYIFITPKRNWKIHFLSPLNPKDQNLNSHLLPLFITYKSSGEKLIKYKANSSCVTMSVILMTVDIIRRNFMLITLRAQGPG